MDYLGYALAVAHRREGGETADTLDRLAQCAMTAAAEARHEDKIDRLLHVAEVDVPRLIREVAELRGIEGA